MTIMMTKCRTPLLGHPGCRRLRQRRRCFDSDKSKRTRASIFHKCRSTIIQALTWRSNDSRRRRKNPPSNLIRPCKRFSWRSSFQVSFSSSSSSCPSVAVRCSAWPSSSRRDRCLAAGVAIRFVGIEWYVFTFVTRYSRYFLTVLIIN